METLDIGSVARKFGLTLRALRFYEQKRLIEPERRETHRLYSEREIVRLERIVAWRRAGLTVREIRQYLGAIERGEDVELRLSRRLAEIAAEARAQLAAVDAVRMTLPNMGAING